MESSDKVSFEIEASSVEVAILVQELIDYFSGSRDRPEFRLPNPQTLFRSIEPTVVVAVVAASATALAAFITGVLAVVKQHNAKRIVIRSKGKEIEVPYGTSPEKMKEVLRVLSKMDQPTIHIGDD